MSYKTNPTVNRVKHTIGWQNINQNSANDFRNLLFLKSWLKLKNWYFLNLQQFTNYKIKLLFITALRRPRKKFLNQKVVPALHVVEDETFDAQDAIQFKKKNSWIALHYKKRKKLFSFLRFEKNLKQSINDNKQITSLNKNLFSTVDKINTLKRSTYLQKIKNKWLYLVQCSNLKNFFVRHNLYKKFLSLKYLNYNLVKKSKKNMYATYDESFLGWEKMTIQLKKIKRRRSFFLSFRASFLKKNALKKKSLSKIKKKIAEKEEKRIMSFIKNKNKLKKLKLNSVKNKLLRFVFNEKNKKKLIFIETNKELLSNKYRHKIKRKIKKLRFFFKLHTKLKKKQKLLVLRNQKKFNLQKHIAWKKNYILALSDKTELVDDFLELVRYMQSYKKNFKPDYKKNLQHFRKWRKRVFKNRRFKEIKQQLLLFDNINKNKKNVTINGSHLETRNPRVFLKWRAFFNINKIRRRENFMRKKTQFNRFRINYIFKKIVKFVMNNHTQKNGKLIIRFVQPVGLLLSTAKIRNMIGRDIYLKRYRRNKLWKKFIPILAALSRYWDPQPLLQQIAYEMQKTKKHWPLLKTIRGLFTSLKPIIFTGYRIAVHGKISSSDRTRVFFFKNGKMPLSSFNSRILYSIWHSHARTGVFSIKGWLYFSNTDSEEKNSANKIAL